MKQDAIYTFTIHLIQNIPRIFIDKELPPHHFKVERQFSKVHSDQF